MENKITLLREALFRQNVQGFILPVNDEFMGEYVPACAKRLEWLTGFSGSAGMVAILPDKAAFFTDGRYVLQAQQEVIGYELYNSSELSPEKWLAQNADADVIIGYDPKLHTLQQITRYKKSSPLPWQALTLNPVDALWQNRPDAPATPVGIHPLHYAGESSPSKRRRIADKLIQYGADIAVLTAPDSICWLLNIRGNDIPYTPFILCYALVHASGNVTVYIEKARLSAEVKAHLGDEIVISSPTVLEKDLQALATKKVLYDSAHSPVWFYHALVNNDAEIIEAEDPCQLPKAIKNAVEIVGMREAHKRDGVAVTQFLHWLDEAVANEEMLTEISVAEKLESFRKVSPLYLEPSFATICGSGSNGAIVHYHASLQSNKTIELNSLLLVDSGGQYHDGTTDITRTLAIGEPSTMMKHHFTLVLKGHIALATAIFPEGTTGSQLDCLARHFLWQEGLDYDHGTGHGVGSYLSVHEGPQRISKRAGDAVLRVGMVLSNEPGYYKAGAYGIRIENLVVVKEVMVSYGKQYLGFETITRAPIDTRLVDESIMTQAELDWLKRYNEGLTIN